MSVKKKKAKKTVSKHWSAKLEKMGACSMAVEWARDFPSLTAAWRACPWVDWMWWLIWHTETGAGRRPDGLSAGGERVRRYYYNWCEAGTGGREGKDRRYATAARRAKPRPPRLPK